MRRAALMVVAALTVGGTGSVLAASPGADTPARTDNAPHGPAPAPGTTVRRQPLLPGYQVVPRGPQLRERCRQEALKRHYRGAERRHFVRRCLLGYGRRLFRRQIQAAPT